MKSVIKKEYINPRTIKGVNIKTLSVDGKDVYNVNLIIDYYSVKERFMTHKEYESIVKTVEFQSMEEAEDFVKKLGVIEI